MLVNETVATLHVGFDGAPMGQPLEALKSILEQETQAATVEPTKGLWRGEWEDGAKVEIVLNGSTQFDTKKDVLGLAERIEDKLNQDVVMVR